MRYTGWKSNIPSPKKMVNSLGRFLAGTSIKSGDPFNSPAFGGSSNSNSFNTSKNQVGAYTALPWVAIAVDALQRDVGGQDFIFTDLDNKEVDINRVPDAVKLPFINDYEGKSFKEMTDAIVAQRALIGNSLLLKTKKSAFGEVNGITEQFIPIRPGKFKPKISFDGYRLLGYEIKLESGVSISVLPEDVIHFRQNAIIDPFWGIGNITKMRLAAEAEAEGDEFTANFLRNRATPSLAITEKTQRQIADYNRIKEKLKQEFQGNKNTGKILYMAGEGIDIKQFQISQKDMQFIQGKEFNRDTTLSMFGVVPEAVGITDDSNRATSGESLNHYFKGINNILVKLELAINAQHVQKIDRRLKFQFSKHITADINQITKMVSTGAITPNRASELLGESTDETDKKRNTFYLPSTLLPIGTVPATPPQNGAASIPENNNRKLIEKQVDLMDPRNFDAIADHFEKSATKPKQFQTKFLRTALKTRSEIEEKFNPAFFNFFIAQGKRVIENIDKSFNKIFEGLSEESVVKLIFDIGLEDEELLKDARRIHTSGIQRSITDINDITGNDLNSTTSNPSVVASINRLGTQITGGVTIDGTVISVNNTTRKEIAKLVLKAKEENWNLNQLQSAIQNKFEQFAGWRARRIARTESRIAWDAGAELSYRNLGVKRVDVVGCVGLSTQIGGEEANSDCGVQNIPLAQASILRFHPNHAGTLAPSFEA